MGLEPIASGDRCGSGGQPCYWVAHDREGNTLYFGGDAANHAGSTAPDVSFHAAVWGPSSAPTAIHAWLLYRVEDIHGNSYVVTYDGGSGFDRRPRRIEYTLPAATVVREIVFGYESRLDRTRAPQHFARRLAQIEIRGPVGTVAGVGLLRTYALAYDYSPASGGSRLTSVTISGSDGKTSTETFVYQNGGGMIAQQIPSVLQLPFRHPNGDPPFYSAYQDYLVGDFNGDARFGKRTSKPDYSK